MHLTAKQVNNMNQMLMVLIASVCSFLIFVSEDPFFEGIILVVLCVVLYDLGRTTGKYTISTKYNQMIHEQQFQEQHPEVNKNV